MPDEFRALVPEGSITGWLAGNGPPVLILHGGPGLSDYTAPLAAELEDAFRVIRYQQRGLAPSVTAGPFGIGQHVADAIAILDASGADRAYVIGHSWGGHLAMHLAVRHPGRVAGLVIVDPLGAVPDGGLADMERNLTERIRPELAARARELDERAGSGQGTAEDALESLAIVWPGYFSAPQAAPPMPPLRISAECLPARSPPGTAWPRPTSSPAPVSRSRRTAGTSPGSSAQDRYARSWSAPCLRDPGELSARTPAGSPVGCGRCDDPGRRTLCSCRLWCDRLSP
jgi:pimeloyl-ACP methyl ester carboxylesterase